MRQIEISSEDLLNNNTGKNSKKAKYTTQPMTTDGESQTTAKTTTKTTELIKNRANQ